MPRKGTIGPPAGLELFSQDDWSERNIITHRAVIGGSFPFWRGSIGPRTTPGMIVGIIRKANPRSIIKHLFVAISLETGRYFTIHPMG